MEYTNHVASTTNSEELKQLWLQNKENVCKTAASLLYKAYQAQKDYEFNSLIEKK